MVGEVCNITAHVLAQRTPDWRNRYLLTISGQSCLLTYNDKVAINVRIFLVVKGHMFVSGAG